MDLLLNANQVGNAVAFILNCLVVIVPLFGFTCFFALVYLFMKIVQTLMK